MNFLDMIECDTANGEGIRISLFVAGCSHACQGCFNPESWNYKAGQPFTHETEERVMSLLSEKYCDGLSILGGDPLADKNFLDVLLLCAKIKHRFTDKNIWLWTGYTLEEIQEHHQKHLILKWVDVIVDGKFEKDKADKTLLWRGSSNQNILRKGEHF